MKIALASTFVPFVDGGARNIVEWLETTLLEAGHEVERVYLPEIDRPETLMRQMAAFRFIDLSAADRLICFRPQAHLIPHPHKVAWFIHHVRFFYDLWNHPEYGVCPDDAEHRGIRDAIRAADTAALQECRRIFTNSQIVSDRVARFNDLKSEVLYPPIFRPERFRFAGMNDEVVYVARVEHHKRQHLLVEALRYCTSPVRVRLCGTGNPEYADELAQMAAAWNVTDRLALDDRWISEEEKATILSECLATAYLPLDEDSYGYPTLESAHSSKPIVTTTDAGGVLEFVRDGVNGAVVAPNPRAIAQVLDQLYEDRERTTRMGEAANKTIDELGINWDIVVERLLA